MYYLKLRIEKDVPGGRLSLYQHEVELDAELIPEARRAIAAGADNDGVHIERARHTVAGIVGNMVKSALLGWMGEDDTIKGGS